MGHIIFHGQAGIFWVVLKATVSMNEHQIYPIYMHIHVALNYYNENHDGIAGLSRSLTKQSWLVSRLFTQEHCCDCLRQFCFLAVPLYYWTIQIVWIPNLVLHLPFDSVNVFFKCLTPVPLFDVSPGWMSGPTFSPPSAEVAEMNRIHYELEYTEGISQRMRIPETLMVSSEKQTGSLPLQQPLPTHTAMMHVPERIVVAGETHTH